MMRSGASHRLAAYAYRDGRVVEYLDQHLYEVALTAYKLASRLKPYAKYAVALTALLHDTGKALNAYQECWLVGKHGECLYTGHEYFSALAATTLVKPESVPEEVAHSAAENLGCTVDDARRGLAKAVVQAVLLHHQAMGHPRDRLEKLLETIGGKAPALSYAEALATTVEKASRKLATALSADYLHVQASTNTIRELNAQLKALLSARDADKALEALRDRVALMLESRFEEKLILLAKLAAGLTIAADSHTAEKQRSDLSRSQLSVIIERLLDHYTQQTQIARNPNTH